MICKRCSLGRQSGFTLLELLVALVVLGFLMVGLTQGVRTGLAMWGAQTRRLGETGELDAGARVLRTLLSDIQTPQPNRTGAATPNFEASPDKLTFVGDLPTGFGTTRRANITLELVNRTLSCAGPRVVTSSRLRPSPSRSKPNSSTASNVSNSPTGGRLRQANRQAGRINRAVPPNSFAFA